MMSNRKQKLAGIIDAVKSKTRGADVNIHDLVEAMESRGFGALLLLPALLTFLPTGAIPGVPGICAILIILIAGQMVFGMDHVYIPRRIQKLSISGKKIDSILNRSKPAMKFIDRIVKQRCDFMFQPITERVIAVLSILLALTFFPLAFIPFAVLPSSAAVIMLALGLLARDGLLVLIGIAIMVSLIFMVPFLGLI